VASGARVAAVARTRPAPPLPMPLAHKGAAVLGNGVRLPLCVQKLELRLLEEKRLVVDQHRSKKNGGAQ